MVLKAMRGEGRRAQVRLERGRAGSEVSQVKDGAFILTTCGSGFSGMYWRRGHGQMSIWKGSLWLQCGNQVRNGRGCCV